MCFLTIHIGAVLNNQGVRHVGVEHDGVRRHQQRPAHDSLKRTTKYNILTRLIARLMLNKNVVKVSQCGSCAGGPSGREGANRHDLSAKSSNEFDHSR